jgi:hypothetical protein
MNQPDASAGEPRAGRNSRLSAEDWAQAALDLIAEQGVAPSRWNRWRGAWA